MWSLWVGRLVVVALFVVTALTSRVSADVVSGARYSVPSGWAAADKDGVRILAPTEQKSGELVVLLLGAEAASGSPAEQLAALTSKLTTDGKVIWSSKVHTTDRGDAGKLHMTSFEVDSPDMGVHGRSIAILVRGDQRVTVLFVFSNEATWRQHGAGVQTLLKSLSVDPKAVTPKPAVPATPSPKVSSGGRLATGETPDRYPGSVGWLPSGRGAPIPAARVVKGRPQGIWWRYQSSSDNTMRPLHMIFLADGTYATNPRPGSGQLFDVEGQRRQPGTTGVGTFSIAAGKITTSADGYMNTDTFTSGTAKGEQWFEIGAGRHYPLAAASAKFLVGTWKGAGNRYVFAADGSVAYGHITNNSDVTIAAGSRGSYQLDGYLIGFKMNNGAEHIDLVGRTGTFLIIGQVVYTRQ